MNIPKKATLGFVFSKDLKQVLLIHKNRPYWQKGKLNGLGGKIESNETPQECMQREVFEESGISILPLQWIQFATIKWDTWYVYVFTSVYSGKEKASSKTDEKIEWVDTDNLPKNCMNNLFWFIPMASDKIENKDLIICNVKY